MIQDPTRFISQLVESVKAARTELESSGRLFGFALCTDDDVRTLFHVACTRQWVSEKQITYKDIGFISVEWQLSGAEELFSALSRELFEDADQPCSNDEDWGASRDARFELLVRSLGCCRSEGLFDSDTLLIVGSTDPSEHLQRLAMQAIDRLNTRSIADQAARALGYEQYRTE